MFAVDPIVQTMAIKVDNKGPISVGGSHARDVYPTQDLSRMEQ